MSERTWFPLADLPPGFIFCTQDGALAVKTAYTYLNGNSQCILLGGGEYAHFADGDRTLVCAVELATQPQAPQPDWSAAPAWAQFWAVDADGSPYWYEVEPKIGLVVWKPIGRYFDADRLPEPDWRATLTRRPEAATP